MTSNSAGSVDPKSYMMKSEVFSHPETDVDTEMGSAENVPAGEELKRNMKGRHINMIAIAGMIVGHAKQVLETFGLKV